MEVLAGQIEALIQPHGDHNASKKEHIVIPMSKHTVESPGSRADSAPLLL